MFLVMVMALFGVGVWALVMAVGGAHALFDTDPGAMRTIEAPHFRIEVPERWQPADDSDGRLPADLGSMTFVHPGGELLVLFPDAHEARGEGALTALAEGLRDPDIRYGRWDVVQHERTLEVHMRYPAPRGEVIGRLIAAVDPNGKLTSVHALCTFDSESLAPLCERVVSSLALSHR
jgi:hypothetical protein